MEETITYSMVVDSLYMSHWAQASSYLDVLESDDLSEQIKWIYENEPEQLVGFTKWIAREFRQYKRDTNFEFYNTLKDVVKNCLSKFEIANRPYFDQIEKKVSDLFNDEDLNLCELEKDYILKTVEMYLIKYYTEAVSLNLVLMETFLSQSVTNFNNYGDLKLADEELHQILIDGLDDMTGGDNQAIRKFLCALNYYIPELNKDNPNYVTNSLKKIITEENYLNFINSIKTNLGSKLDIYALYRILDGK